MKYLTKRVIFKVVYLLFFVIIFSWLFEFLRFGSPRLNYLAVGFAFVSPWIVNSKPFSGDFGFLAKWYTYSARIVSIPLLILWLLLMVFWIPAVLIHDVNYLFERIETIEIQESVYKVYRTNGGATTAFGIVVRKETALLFGLNYVSVVHSNYPASRVTDYYIEDGKPIFKSK